MKVNKKSPTDDKDMLSHIRELVEEVGEDKVLLYFCYSDFNLIF